MARKSRSRLNDLVLWALPIFAVVPGCSSDPSTGLGAGGASSASTGGMAFPSGGGTNSGGTSTSGTGASLSGSGGSSPGTGGLLGTGGVSSTGGSFSTGGVSSTGGSFSTGGVSSTGGSFSTGGAVASGGTVSTGGTPGYDPGYAINTTHPDTCFDLLAHQNSTPNDSTKFNVKTGEFYHDFVFKTPYTVPVWGLNFTALVDNSKVVHHFLLFQVVSGSGWTDGSQKDEIGTHPNSVLVAVWTPGNQPLLMPQGVGEELPAPGGFFELEIHYFNNTGAVAEDRSGMHICATSTQQKDTATITWLGTESLVLPPNAPTTAQGTCKPSFQGGDIHLIQSNPHMHKLGTHMKTVINRAAGGTTTLVDSPFSFLDQRNYATLETVHPGDTLTTVCTFDNTTSNLVLFGPPTSSEMCYNFVLSYPAHALANPGGSLEGSQNTCLHQ